MRLRVLVVDDEPLAREGLKLLLGRQPQVESVSEARNGREAIASIREQKPDLVLLDVQMPRIDGFAVVHAIGAERMPAGDLRDRARPVRDPCVRDRGDRLSAQAGHRGALRARVRAGRRPAAGRAARGGHPTGAGDARCHRESAAAARAIRGSIRRAHNLRAAWTRWTGSKRSRTTSGCTSGPATHLLHVPMNTIEAVLDSDRFLRIHRSHIVNVQRIAQLWSIAHGQYVDRAQVRAAPAIGADLRRADPPRAHESVLTRKGSDQLTVSNGDPVALLVHRGRGSLCEATAL